MADSVIQKVIGTAGQDLVLFGNVMLGVAWCSDVRYGINIKSDMIGRDI